MIIDSGCSEGGDTLDKMKDLLSSNVKGVKEVRLDSTKTISVLFYPNAIDTVSDEHNREYKRSVLPRWLLKKNRPRRPRRSHANTTSRLKCRLGGDKPLMRLRRTLVKTTNNNGREITL